MSKRTKTPDLMSKILSGNTESQPSGNTEILPSGRPSGPAGEALIKSTYHLRESTLLRLEQALLGLRIATGRRDITRYELVEQALQIALADYEQQGQDSQLAKRLL